MAIDQHDEQLSTVIRTATWADHEAAERAPFVQDLLAGRLPIGEYGRLVAQHHAIYAALEALVAENSDPELAPFLAPELTRLPAIEADLDFLVGDGWRRSIATLPSTDAYCAHLLTVGSQWSGGLLAHHYVRYLGDLSGGQIIGRVLQRVYELPDQRGTSFYRFSEIASPRQFKLRYRALLDGLPWDAAMRERLITEVSTAFKLTAAIFYELAPLPVLASGRHRAAQAGAPGE